MQMTGPLYLCASAAEFPAQAVLRLRPELRTQPVAVLEGNPPQQSVRALNVHARRLGAAVGITRLEAEAIPGLQLLTRSSQTEAAARAVFLECAAQFSPRIEEASKGTACAVILDIAGTERLFGPPRQLAEWLRRALMAAGFRASIAVSANYHVAQMKAASSRGPHRQVFVDGVERRGINIISAGEEASALAQLPIAALSLATEHAETLGLWGIRTLGELAALPEADLVARLGPQAAHWRALARGAASHTFQPIEPEFTLEEFCEFEEPVEQLDSLLFVGARMIDCLATRAASRALLLAQLTVRMKLENGTTHERAIRPALPTADRKFLLKLLQLEIGSHPPQAAVIALTLTAQAGQSSTVQLGLFTPQTPEPSRLDVTLARLKALVGDDRVGAPALEDSHRPGSFRMREFSSAPCNTLQGAPSFAQSLRTKGGTAQNSIDPPRMALRRVRPPAPVRVAFSKKSGNSPTETAENTHSPAAFFEGKTRYEITAAYGPWRTSGCWWADAWNTEEWDVLATTPDGATVACLLACDRARRQWRLEAFYD
jgi:protein ImuB